MSLELVKSKLLARIELSNKLIIFIENVLTNKTPKKELDAFYMDIFNEKINKPLEVLPSLKAAISTSIQTYKKMIALCDHGNKPVSIAEFDMRLEYEGLMHEKLIKMFSAQNPSFAKNVKYLSEEKSFFDDLRVIIKPNWPKFYQYFRGHFYFRLMNKQFNKFEQHQIQKTEFQLDVIFNEEKSVTAAFHLFSKHYPKHNPALFKEEHNKYNQIIERLGEAANRYVDQHKHYMSGNIQNQFSNLAGNVAGFYDVILKLRANADVVHEAIEAKIQQANVQKALAFCLENGQIKLQRRQAQFNLQQENLQAIQKVFATVKDEAINLILKKIMIAQKLIASKINEFECILGTVPDPLVFNNEEIKKLRNEMSGLSAFIKKITIEYSQYIKEYTVSSEDFIKEKQLNELLLQREETQAFVLKQKNHLILWQQKIEQSKQLRMQAKPTLVLQPSSTNSAPKVQSNEEIERVVDSIEYLSSNYINLMKGIFCKEKGIFYTQVLCLITNQLHGKILEHGNGSSHKTILLRNFTTEFLTDQKFPEMIKSGACKPHGKGHQSGELCGFNLELVQEALMKAGITPEVIEALENRQFNNKFKKITF